MQIDILKAQTYRQAHLSTLIYIIILPQFSRKNNTSECFIDKLYISYILFFFICWYLLTLYQFQDIFYILYASCVIIYPCAVSFFMNDIITIFLLF